MLIRILHVCIKTQYVFISCSSEWMNIFYILHPRMVGYFLLLVKYNVVIKTTCVQMIMHTQL